jgi:hypothetical protein
MGQNLKHFKMRMLFLLVRGAVGVMVLVLAETTQRLACARSGPVAKLLPATPGEDAKGHSMMK